MDSLNTHFASRPTRRRAGLAAIVIATVLLACNVCLAEEPPFVKPSDGSTELLLKMLAATLVVLVLGAVAFWVVRKVLPRISQTSGKRMTVLETAYLAPRRAIHLLKVGSMTLLVASSQEGIVKLEDVTSAFGADYDEVASRVSAEQADNDQPEQNK